MKRNVGQPKKENPKNIKLTVRFSSQEYEKLVLLSKEFSVTKPFLIRSILNNYLKNKG